jgi:hypothetical protein
MIWLSGAVDKQYMLYELGGLLLVKHTLAKMCPAFCGTIKTN